MFGSPDKAFQYRPCEPDVCLAPEVSLLEFLDGHLFGSEDHMAHVVMRPVTVKDPPLLLQPLLQRGPRKRGENRKGGKFDIVFLDKFDSFFKDARIISIEPKDKGSVNANSMALNDFQ